MRPNIETLSYFDKVASFLKLTDSERATARDMINLGEITENDPALYDVCCLVKTGSLTSAMIEDFKRQGAELVTAIKSALAENRSGLSDDIDAAMGQALVGVQKDVSDKIAGGIQKTLADLVSNVDLLVKKEADRRHTIKLAQIAGGIAFAIALTFLGGYSLGRDSINATAARFENLMARPDASAALKVFANNDMNRVLADCGGVGNLEFRGAPACKPTIAVGTSLNSVEGVNGVKLIWTQLVVKTGALGLLAAGLAAGGAVGWWLARRKRAAY